MRESELVTDREGDEAKGNVADDGEVVYVLHRDKADTGHTESAKAIGADQDSGYEICGYCGKVKLLRNTGEKKTDYKCD